MASVFSFLQKPILKYLLSFFIGLYLLIWAVSSPVIKYFAKQPLAELGLTLTDKSSIHFNPFLTQIKVENLELLSKNKVVFSLESLELKLALHQILFDKISVQTFTLQKGYLLVEQQDKQLIIAGVNLPTKESTEQAKKQNETLNKIPNKTQEKGSKNNEAANFVYQVILPKLQLDDFTIDYISPTVSHQLSLKSLLISEVNISQEKQQAKLALNALVDQAALNITADAQIEQGNVALISTLSLENYALDKLKSYASPLSQLNGDFSLSSKQKLNIHGDNISLTLTDTHIANENLALTYQQQYIALAAFKQDFSHINLTLVQGKLTQLVGESNITLNNASVQQGEQNEQLLGFEKLALNNIDFTVNQQSSISIDDLIVDNIVMSKVASNTLNKVSSTTDTNDENKSLPPILHLKQFSISDIKASETSLAINKIILDTLKSDIIINKEKMLANLVSLANNQTLLDEEVASEKAAKQALNEISSIENNATGTNTAEIKHSSFMLSLNEFSLQNGGEIDFIDNSVDPIYQRTLYIDTLTLGALSNSTQAQNNQTPFKLVGRSNKYANFNFHGLIQPFAEQATYQLEGFLKELSLPAVSTYMKQAMQIELKSGQLNTDVKLDLKGDKLDGNVVIVLQGLETAIANDDEVDTLIDQGALPLNLALGMLKDSDGNVELDVPLSGSTSDPQFGLSSIVSLITQKAIFMATQDYLMKTFVPYANIVSVAMSVGDFALKVRFEDLPYQAKQIKPNKAQAEFLQQFIALMKDKDDAKVKICAISTPADIGLAAGTTVTNKKEIKRLKEIANKREHAFKEYIIEHGDIKSSRLMLCSPQIDSDKDAVPRISLSV